MFTICLPHSFGFPSYSDLLCAVANQKQHLSNQINMDINLRPATLGDLSDLQTLFVAAILRTCRNDYQSEQLQVWIASVENDQRWKDAINSQYFLVAEVDNSIAGFGSLEENNYIDFMYVHPDYHRKGVAKCIYQALEKEAIRQKGNQLTSNVSITARPFFLAQGFEIVKENRNQIRGVEIINYRMKKDL